MISGAITNSGKAVTFTLAGLISTGLLTARKALPFIIGGSLGSAFLVLWAAIDFKYMVLVILGITGLYYQFGDMKSSRTKMTAGILLGFGLLFYGLQLIKTGASPIREFSWFTNFILATQEYWLPALFIGAIAALIAQSGSAVSIIAITLVNADLLNMDQTIMLIYGTNIGSGVSTGILAYTLPGTSRQLVLFHAFFKIAGSVLLVPLLYLETYAGIPLIKHLVSFLTSSSGIQIAIIYLLYELVTGIVLAPLLNKVSELLSRYSPPSDEEVFSNLKYISEVNLEDIESASALLEKEQARLLRNAPNYLDKIRDEVNHHEKLDYKVLHNANGSINKEIQYYIASLLKLDPTPTQAETLFYIHNIQESINSINESLYELVDLIHQEEVSSSPQLFITKITEGLHAILTTACESLESTDSSDADLLVLMTADRGGLTDKLKQDYLTSEKNLNIQEKKTLLAVLSYYERIIWGLNKVGR